MAHTVDVYHYGLKLGSGNATNGGSTITSYSGTAPGSNSPTVQIVGTNGSNALGRHFTTRVISGSGTSTLTLASAHPHGD